jgi:hypothetical protein
VSSSVGTLEAFLMNLDLRGLGRLLRRVQGFHTLSGGAFLDWGVCGNPASHRAGLLTSEQNGCPEFEQE